MIAQMLITWLFGAGDLIDPAASLTPWVSILTGSGGALIVLGLWVKALTSEKKEMVVSHREKDKQLIEITREAISCIEASIGRADAEGEFLSRIWAIMERIETKLDNL